MKWYGSDRARSTTRYIGKAGLRSTGTIDRTWQRQPLAADRRLGVDGGCGDVDGYRRVERSDALTRWHNGATYVGRRRAR